MQQQLSQNEALPTLEGVLIPVKEQITFSEPLDPEEVLHYLDMRFDEKWWPEVTSVDLLTEEPVGVGSVFVEVSKIWGPIKTTVEATVVEYGRDDEENIIMTLHGKGSSLSYIHKYTVSADGTTLTWSSDVYLPKFLGFLKGRIQKAIGNQLQQNLPKLQNFLEQKIKEDETGVNLDES